MTPIAAKDVLRVLQRVADGTASNFSCDGELLITIYADGWAITFIDDAGQVDGVYYCVAPDGTVAQMQDWPTDGDPSDLLSEADNDAIIRRVNQAPPLPPLDAANE